MEVRPQADTQYPSQPAADPRTNRPDRTPTANPATDDDSDRPVSRTRSSARAHGKPNQMREWGASYLVQDAEGPLEEGELERARACGAELAGSVRGAASNA
jgi:hypothetical protein